MTTVDALLIGVFSTLLGIGILVSGLKVWRMLEFIPKLKTTMDRQVAETVVLSEAAKVIAQELQYMRTLATAQASQNPMQPGETPYQPPQPGIIPQFPSPILDRFPVRPAPDAELNDTDDVSLTQTDEDMAQMEAIEKLRSQGVQVDEPDVVHPGVTVESE